MKSNGNKPKRQLWLIIEWVITIMKTKMKSMMMLGVKIMLSVQPQLCSRLFKVAQILLAS